MGRDALRASVEADLNHVVGVDAGAGGGIGDHAGVVPEGIVMPGEKTEIRNHIRRLRFEHGEMTQDELAKQAGVTRHTIMALEAGKYRSEEHTAELQSLR